MAVGFSVLEVHLVYDISSSSSILTLQSILETEELDVDFIEKTEQSFEEKVWLSGVLSPYPKVPIGSTQMSQKPHKY